MTSIANAIIAYGFLKYSAHKSYPVGLMALFAAFVDIIIAIIISIGL